MPAHRLAWPQRIIGAAVLVGALVAACAPAPAQPAAPASTPTQAAAASKPTTQPSAQPSAAPAAQPSTQPSAQPSAQAAPQPSAQPAAKPSSQPSVQPSPPPAAQPTAPPAAAPRAPLTGLVTSGKLTLATAGNFPPFTQVNPSTGKVEGYSIDVFGEAAKRLGLDLDTPTVDFVAELQGLSSGQYDVADSGIRATPERQQQFLFTIPVASGGYGAGVLAKNKDMYSAGIDDVKGLNTGAIAGSIPEKYLLDNKDKLQYASYTGFPGAAEAFSALQTGRIDLFLNDSTPLLYFNKQNPGVIALVGPTINPSPFSGAIRLGNEQLQSALNSVIKDMIADGTIGKLMQKSFGACLGLPADINAAPPYENPPGC